MPNSPQCLRNGAVTRCAICGGKFGLIQYHSARTSFCSKKCLDRFKARQERDRRWILGLQTA
jgi:recombinational DNA repair protein (RecF pathway)